MVVYGAPLTITPTKEKGLIGGTIMDEIPNVTVRRKVHPGPYIINCQLKSRQLLKQLILGKSNRRLIEGMK
jgi:hypothetical protein